MSDATARRAALGDHPGSLGSVVLDGDAALLPSRTTGTRPRTLGSSCRGAYALSASSRRRVSLVRAFVAWHQRVVGVAGVERGRTAQLVIIMLARVIACFRAWADTLFEGALRADSNKVSLVRAFVAWHQRVVGARHRLFQGLGGRALRGSPSR